MATSDVSTDKHCRQGITWRGYVPRWRLQGAVHLLCPMLLLPHSSPCHCLLVDHATLRLHARPLYGQAEGVAVGFLGQGYVLLVPGVTGAARVRGPQRVLRD